MTIDDLMAEGKSKKNGSFFLSGSETEATKIDPKLNIYHNCNDERKVSYLIIIEYFCSIVHGYQ